MFRKNVASQFIHFQGVDAATGGIKTGVTWTIRRCIDGTFAAGGGTVTEDGTAGWYKYAMSQADTNGNNIGFNFTGTGAVPQTINIVTTAADPTDATAFGISRIDAAISSRMATFTLPTNFSSLVIDVNGRVDLSKWIGVTPNALISGRVDANAQVVGDKTGYSLTQAFPTNFSSLAITAGGAVTVGTNNDKTGYAIGSGGIDAAALTAAALNAIADQLLDRNMSTGTDSGTDSTSVRTPRQALRVLRNKASIAAGTLTVTKEDDSTTSWTAAVSTTAGNPISAVDPT